MNEINQMLEERGNTHGNFVDNSRISQEMKDVIRTSKKWASLTTTQREALDMIAHKIGRIIAGNPNHVDHWQDIVGYVTLIVKELQK